MIKNILLGYSGHSYVVAEAALQNKLSIIGYTDHKEAMQNPFNLKYMGFEKNDDFEGWNKNYGFILGVGDNRIRNQIADFILRKNEELVKIIHPSAIIADKVNVGKGVFIGAGAIINPMVKISDTVIINTGAIVEHECNIKKGVHIAPSAVLAGNVSVGMRSFIGSNSFIKEGVNIGEDVIIGAGTVVLTDVPSGNKVVGNPARFI
ncbi:MAG: acetyltransferase [Candidatus Paceibacterota bacterium]